MRLVSRPGGAIQALIRERHPFAVLAILAACLPTLLIGAGLHGGASALRLVDGTFVICTASGFQPIDEPAGTGEHDLNDCCKAGCVHSFSKVALGPAPAAVATPVEFAVDIDWLPGGPEARHGSDTPTAPIRAPPVASA